MNKKILGIVAAIIVIIAGSMIFLLNNSSARTEKQEMINTNTNAESSSPAPATPKNETTVQPGTYIDYSPTAIANSSGTKLLFFHAPWCPQCRALESDIKSSGVPAGVTIIKVDYDTSQSLRQKYGVTLQTTIVKVDDQGNLVSKFVAYDDPSLNAIKKNLL